MGVPAVLVGAFLLGSGITISGTCPGTIWAALGTGNSRMLITMFGGVCGAAAVGVVWPWIHGSLRRGSIPLRRRTLPTLLNKPAWLTGTALVICMFAVVGLLTVLVPTSVYPYDDPNR
jgi:hypothetical protein